MNIEDQIKEYISIQAEPKQAEMEELHRLILRIAPQCKLWYENGKNSENKTVSNPNIGYGFYTIKYPNGKTREFYRVGLSANTTGISVYIMGIYNKTFLSKTFGEKIGRASVTGYCIKFKTLKDVNIEVLESAIKYRFEQE